MHENFPKRHKQLEAQLGKLHDQSPLAIDAFMDLHEKSIADGALSTKIKELIALGIAVTVRCDGCISFHVGDALKAGASREEILETLGVAVMMGGGPAAMYACDALEALDQFEHEAA